MKWQLARVRDLQEITRLCWVKSGPPTDWSVYWNEEAYEVAGTRGLIHPCVAKSRTELLPEFADEVKFINYYEWFRMSDEEVRALAQT